MTKSSESSVEKHSDRNHYFCIQSTGLLVTERIKLDTGIIHEEMCTLKGTSVIGFKEEFMTNFMIPEYIGLGKSVSRGFGTIERIK